VREMSISENYEGEITPIRSNISRFSRGTVKELVEKIDQYVQTSVNYAQPFGWTATADSIFAKVQRLCERISGTGH
jgi:putative transposase